MEVTENRCPRGVSIEPMSDTFLYFAYGSNMLTSRLTKRTPSAVCIGNGFVRSHRLTFDKVSKDGSGKAHIEHTGKDTDRVYGVLFRISTNEKTDLDREEGRGKGYKDYNVEVVTGETAIPAKTYAATEREAACRPYDWYKAIVIAGAVEHSLPAPYIEWLRTAHSIPDPKPERRRENESLLLGVFESKS